MSSERRIELEVEVPATPEQAWEAIATGPGITAWFMPAEVDGRVGGSVVHHQEGFPISSGTVTDYDPPHRFSYEEEPPIGQDEPGARPIATEFLVEARSGGTCVVRVVMSGFGEGETWERAIESFSAGWGQVLLSLRLYLANFPGEPAASVNAGATANGDVETVWSELARALGLPPEPRVGERVTTGAAGAPTLAGTVEDADEHLLTLLLDEPGPGLGLIGVGGPGEQVHIVVRAQLFGPDAAEIAARAQEEWNSWVAQRHGATA
jgi:uncharacterized protein YndB with AHSA1/START domain